MPARQKPVAGGHPIAEFTDGVVDIFHRLGFSFMEVSELDTFYNNFWSLNFPKDHPALDMHDTFYVDGGKYLLRTHTSNFQNYAMKNYNPPLRFYSGWSSF